MKYHAIEYHGDRMCLHPLAYARLSFRIQTKTRKSRAWVFVLFLPLVSLASVLYASRLFEKLG